MQCVDATPSETRDLLKGMDYVSHLTSRPEGWDLINYACWDTGVQLPNWEQLKTGPITDAVVSSDDRMLADGIAQN